MEAPTSSPTRYIIYVTVTNIPGNPLARPFTLWKLFCEKHLGRRDRRCTEFSLEDGIDGLHVPQHFDSENDVKVYFLFDAGVREPLDRDQVLDLPHESYFASKVENSDEWRFIPRPCTDRMKKTAAHHAWGSQDLKYAMNRQQQTLKAGKMSPPKQGQKDLVQ